MDGTGDGSATPGSKALEKSDDYLKQFDTWIIGFTGFGLAAALLFGISSGTCPGPSYLRTPGAAPTSTPSPTGSPATPSPTGSPDAEQPDAEQPDTADNGTVDANVTAAGAAGNEAEAAVDKATAAAGSARKRSDDTAKPLPFTCGSPGWSGMLGGLLAVAIALAALAVGAFVGFLFGLPRTLTGDQDNAGNQPATRTTAQTSTPGTTTPAQGNQQATATVTTPRTRIGSGVNTNLERVSNWLTTIIVGVGLTKLETLPGTFLAFGRIVDPYFGFGGGVFAISAVIYFLIAGFFLIYIGTRVKLSLVFVLSQRDNEDAGSPVPTSLMQAVTVSSTVPPIATPATMDASAVEAAKAAAPSNQGLPSTQSAQETLQRSDEELLKRSLTDLKTNEEIIAWSNAKARTGDYSAARTGYEDVMTRMPLNPDQTSNYAAILAATGEKARAESVITGLQASQALTPAAASDAREKLSVANVAAMRARLQQGLYRPEEKGYDQSIEAGEALFKMPDQDGDALAHLWLACAYGQRHSALVAAGAPAAEIDAARRRAIEELTRAVTLDPTLKQLARTLYYPDQQVAGDDDLQSLYKDDDIETLLKDG